jgi:hypothetical protein
MAPYSRRRPWKSRRGRLQTVNALYRNCRHPRWVWGRVALLPVGLQKCVVRRLGQPFFRLWPSSSLSWSRPLQHARPILAISCSRPPMAMGSKTAWRRAENVAAPLPTPGASLRGASTPSNTAGRTPKGTRAAILLPAAIENYRRKSEHFTVSAPPPHGAIGTLEVEFLGEPSTSLSV